jgi:hypothetical protein
VKQERLDFLADNPFYTKRFAYYGDVAKLPNQVAGPA